MSRTFSNICGGGVTTADSEKKDKRICNRILRRKSKQIVSSKEEDDIEIFPKKQECYNKYCMEKDGKTIYYTKQEIVKALKSILNKEDDLSPIILYYFEKMYGHKSEDEKIQLLTKKVGKVANTILRYIKRK